MDVKTKKMLALAGAGVLAYYFLVHKKREQTLDDTVSEFSNIGGRRRRRKRDKWQDRLNNYCKRHPNSASCRGLIAGGGGPFNPDVIMSNSTRMMSATGKPKKTYSTEADAPKGMRGGPFNPRAIMSNSSGFGGANVSLIFTPYKLKKTY